MQQNQKNISKVRKIIKLLNQIIEDNLLNEIEKLKNIFLLTKDLKKI